MSALCVWYSCPFLLPTTHLPSLLCVQAGITPLSSIAALRHCPTNSCCCPAVLLCFVVTFLQGLCFYSTKSVIPEFATLRTIVQAAGGEVGHRLYVRTYVCMCGGGTQHSPLKGFTRCDVCHSLSTSAALFGGSEEGVWTCS